MTTKICSECNLEKDISKFSRNWTNGKAYGYKKVCCLCNYNKYYRGKKYGKRFKWATATEDEKKIHALKIIQKNTQRDGECLLWIKAKRKDNYAGMMYENKFMAAHRVAWIIHKGSIPNGMWVLHRCDRPDCLEIRHLFLGTPKMNFDDMVKKGRRKFQKGSECKHAILTEADVVEIKKTLKEGTMNTTQLGAKYNVSEGAISDIKRNKNWKHVKI